MKSTDLCQKGFLAILIFCKSVSLIIERSLKKCFNFEGIIFLCESEYNSLIFLIADDKIDRLISWKHGLDLAIGLEEGNVLVEDI